MNEKPEWYRRLNLNERRIIDVFVETGINFFISRPVLEMKLCKTGLMNQRTLTSRLDYLIKEKGIIGKVIGEKGAVFYAPSFLVKQVLADPIAKSSIDCGIDSSSPKKFLAFSMPVKVKREKVSDAEMWGLLVRAGVTWEKVGRGSPRQKEKVYRDLQKRRRELERKADGAREDGV